MPIQTAMLAAGRHPRNSAVSANETIVGQIYTVSEKSIKAVVKSLTPRQIANELIASTILEKLGLPTPRSFLVFAEVDENFGAQAPIHENGMYMYFASEWKPYKCLIDWAGGNDSAVFTIINGYVDWGKIVGFDEWIAYGDRHFRNFLYDGTTLYVFDHDLCLSGDCWTPAGLDPERLYPCHKRTTQTHLQMPETKRLAAATLAGVIEAAARSIDLEAVLAESLASEVGNDIPQDLPAARNFLEQRIPHIARLCALRLGVGGLA